MLRRISIYALVALLISIALPAAQPAAASHSADSAATRLVIFEGFFSPT